MTRCSSTMDLGPVDEALGALVAAQLDFGKAALKLLTEGANAAFAGLKDTRLPVGGSCCDIPEPCWMPLDLGEICCEVCPGETGEICVVVANEDFRPHEYTIAAVGDAAGQVKASEPKFTLGPKQRKTVSVKFAMPPRRDGRDDTCCETNDYEVVVWILGCHNHYLRWNLNYLDEGRKTACCHEVVVNDEPNYELHWYDHFHVYRPCFGPQTAPVKR